VPQLRSPGLLAAVVRGLSARLPVTRNPKVLTFVVGALEAICQRHVAQFGSVVAALNSIEADDNDGLRLAASALLRSATSAGVEVDLKLITRFESALTKSIMPAKRAAGKANRR
jgi:adenylate cyclase